MHAAHRDDNFSCSAKRSRKKSEIKKKQCSNKRQRADGERGSETKGESRQVQNLKHDFCKGEHKEMKGWGAASAHTQILCIRCAHTHAQRTRLQVHTHRHGRWEREGRRHKCIPFQLRGRAGHTHTCTRAGLAAHHDGGAGSLPRALSLSPAGAGKKSVPQKCLENLGFLEYLRVFGSSWDST